MTGKEKQTPLHLTSQCMVAEQVHLQPNSDINLKQRISIHRFYAGWRLADSSIPISFIYSGFDGLHSSFSNKRHPVLRIET